MYETVRLRWRKARSLKFVGERYNDREKHNGLYQVYGRHPVYGRKVLLYIGKAADLSFQGRLYAHLAQTTSPIYSHLQHQAPEDSLRVHLAFAREMTSGRRRFIDAPLLADLEAMLIFTHLPALNTGNTKTYKGRWLTIINDGYRGDLHQKLLCRPLADRKKYRFSTGRQAPICSKRRCGDAAYVGSGRDCLCYHHFLKAGGEEPIPPSSRTPGRPR